MHIFLTGPKHIGKSTIIQKVISKWKLNIGGFITYPGINNDLNIYISSVNDTKKYEAANRIAKRNSDGVIGIIENFNELGVMLINKDKANASLLIMDELGFLEQEATNFKNSIYKCLNENIPILGVIKDRYIPWLEVIRNHPSVEIITVTKDNRDDLADIIIKKLKGDIK